MGGKGSGRNRTADYAAMREYKAQGHSMQEVADHFGVCEQTAQRACKGISPQTSRRHQVYRNGWDAEKQVANAIRTINDKIPMFEYVGGFTNSDGFADIRCKKCGAVLHKSYVSIRHGKTTCENCEHIESEKRKEHEKLIKTQKKEWEKAGKRKVKQLSFAVCECCGSLFFPESGCNKKYCSVECADKHHNSTKKDRRMRKLSTVMVDKDITLKDLFKRDGGG